MEQPLHPPVPKPLKRSKLRKTLGRSYFIFRRKLSWYTSGTRFAKPDRENRLPVEVFSHATPLMRKLPGLDMQLQRNKVVNLGIAIECLDGLTIHPGETFSYWYCIGKPVKRKGYLPGLQLDQGKLKTSTGGGLCQLSNLIFWMSMHTPLTIVERWRHSYDVFPDVRRTQPFGSGATCAYNYIDLQLRNDTDQSFQLALHLDETHLHGAWLAEGPLKEYYEVFESDHLFRQEFWGHTRHNRIARRVFEAETGELIREEPLVENHAIMMYNPMLGEGND